MSISVEQSSLESVLSYIQCGVLNGDNSTAQIVLEYQMVAVEDCTGVCGGDAVEDECGVCGGDSSTCSL